MASVVMLILSYPTETVLSNKIAKNAKVLSFKDSPRKRLGRGPFICHRSLSKKGVMGDYHTPGRGTMEIIPPEGHIIPPEGGIISIGPRAGVL